MGVAINETSKGPIELAVLSQTNEDKRKYKLQMSGMKDEMLP